MRKLIAKAVFVISSVLNWKALDAEFVLPLIPSLHLQNFAKPESPHSKPTVNNYSIPNNSGIPHIPSFGRSMRSHFPLAKDFILLDHGAFGLVPNVILSAFHSHQSRAESNIELWMRREAKREVTKVREALASFVKAPSSDDIVVIPSTTSGMNAIFRSLALESGDRILIFSTTYKSMLSVVQYVVDSSNGAVSSLTFNLTYPISNDEIVGEFEAFLTKETLDHPTRPIRIALLHHISCRPGAILPIERMIPLLKSRNITVLIDGAHAIGQIPINLSSLAPDYYVSDCHKWLFTARTCSMMYVDKKSQKSLHPALINFAYKTSTDFQNEFYSQGTTDFSAYLTVIDALRLRAELGGEEVINKYNHELAVEGGRFLASQWNTEVLQDEDQIGNMVDVRLPLKNPKAKELSEDFWINLMLDNYPNIYFVIHNHGGQHWWARISAQIYNDMGDFVVADKIIREICLSLSREYI